MKYLIVSALKAPKGFAGVYFTSLSPMNYNDCSTNTLLFGSLDNS